MVEHVEGKALPQIPPEVGLQEIVSPLKEIPCVIKLDSPQHREFVLLILGTGNVVDSSRREDNARANCNSNELVIHAGDGVESGSVSVGRGKVRSGSGHRV